MEIKNLDLDKICRVCLTVKKDMRPLFGEMVADMLMDFARVQIENTDGWPDKICVQCVHQVSRCHAFKNRVEKSDQQLRQYIKGITVIVEEALPKEMTITQIELQRADIQRSEVQTHTLQSPQRQEFQIVKDIHSVTGSDGQPQQMIITNGQIHNAQILNAAGQIVTSHGQPVTVQTSGGQIVQAGQIIHQGPIVQAGNTLQMINQNGQTQVVQIQRTSDDRCEIIVQPEMTGGGETHYYDDGMITITQQIEAEEESQIIEEVEEEEEEQQELSEMPLSMSDAEDPEDKEYLAEFISLQTSCPSPGRYICNLCRKEFKHSKWLHSHMKQHSNWIKANCKKQPQCQICGRSFKGPGMLKMHMKTHEAKPVDKIPTCSICNKEFKSKTILYRHRQTHFEKTFQCDQCSKSFVSNYHLKTHMAKHNKASAAENKFKCYSCDKTYTNSNELKSHVQQHLSNSGKVDQ